MKKVIFVFALLFTALVGSQDLKAQAFEEGTNVINLGIGVGGYYSFGFIYPGFSASWEIGVIPTGDFGVVGFGAFAGVRYAQGDAGGIFTTGIKRRSFTVGGAPRATYHFTIIPVENLDVYAGAQIFVGIQTDSYSEDNPLFTFDDSDTYTVVDPGVFAGVRYYFGDNIAVFGEVGYSFNFLTGGISFRF